MSKATIPAALAALDAAQAAIESARAALLAAGAPKPSHDTTVTPTATAPPGTWLKLKDAARKLGLHDDSLARLAKKHGLGRRVAGVGWRIDMERATAHLAGEHFTPIRQVSSEITGNDGNGSDACDGPLQAK